VDLQLAPPRRPAVRQAPAARDQPPAARRRARADHRRQPGLPGSWHDIHCLREAGWVDLLHQLGPAAGDG